MNFTFKTHISKEKRLLKCIKLHTQNSTALSSCDTMLKLYLKKKKVILKQIETLTLSTGKKSFVNTIQF